MEILRKIANVIIDQHVSDIEKLRQKRILFKKVDENGKVYGRPFTFNCPTYKKCFQEKQSVLELSDKQKRGDDKKYFYALNIILNGCNGCKKKMCPYCKFDIHDTDRLNSLHDVLHTMSDKWQMFAHENNFAPTKKVLLLLFDSFSFMSVLEKQMKKKGMGNFGEYSLSFTFQKNKEILGIGNHTQSYLPNHVSVLKSQSWISSYHRNDTCAIKDGYSLAINYPHLVTMRKNHWMVAISSFSSSCCFLLFLVLYAFKTKQTRDSSNMKKQWSYLFFIPFEQKRTYHDTDTSI